MATDACFEWTDADGQRGVINGDRLSVFGTPSLQAANGDGVAIGITVPGADADAPWRMAIVELLDGQVTMVPSVREQAIEAALAVRVVDADGLGAPVPAVDRDAAEKIVDAILGIL